MKNGVLFRRRFVRSDAASPLPGESLQSAPSRAPEWPAQAFTWLGKALKKSHSEVCSRICPESPKRNGNSNEFPDASSSGPLVLPTSGPIISVLHLPLPSFCTQNGEGVVSITPLPFGDVWPNSMQKVTGLLPAFSTLA